MRVRPRHPCIGTGRVYFDGSLAGAARLAILFRGLVPEDGEAVFCDDEYAFEVRVTAHTTEDDLVRGAGAG
jgi:hypothetical protein